MRGSAILPIIVAGITPFLLLVLIVSGLGFGLVAWKPPIQWTRTFGPPSGGENGAAGVAVDASGVYLAGYSDYAGITHPGGSLLLARYDPNGEMIWTRTIGDFNSDIAAISVGTGAIFLTGINATANSGYIERFDPSGNRLWSMTSTIGTGGVAVSPPGIYVAGEDVATNSEISEFGTDGSLLWSRRVFNATGAVTGQVSDDYVDSSGVYISGWINGAFPGQKQIGTSDGFLAKYSLDGTLLWARQFGDGFGDVGYGVRGDSGGIYVSGTTYLGMMAGFGWLKKYDSTGNLIWSIRIDSPDGSGMGDSSLATGSSGIYVSFSTPAARDYLMKYDASSGQQVWSFLAGSPKQIYAVGTAYRVASISDAIYIGGSLLQAQSANSLGFVSRVGNSPSLIFFGLNPPWSFTILAVLVCGSVLSVMVFRKLRHKRARPTRVGPAPQSLPATD